MAKLFTIAEGLENLGALKTGGQGSVYKGRRQSEVITAIKLLPTPILSEDMSDKNYKGFVNEVEKLKRVNEEHNPNVVRIIGSGITDTGCFPYIEMEFIDGPDLGELLKPPHEPVFSIHEAIKVACQLSNALAHCHRCGIKHGDIKSNNIKYNRLTGNYVLLDFGLAIMSDEDRRTSLRYAGAIEFMAPEQNKGEVFFETDVYSFGVILFELLAGRVPFPLHDSGETARNAVMLSHMETPPPQLTPLRRQNMPAGWMEEKPYEADVPQWLSTMVYKCLEKKPEDRFKNGEELHRFIMENSNAPAVAPVAASVEGVDMVDAERLQRENNELKQLVAQYQKAAAINEEKISSMQNIIRHHESLSVGSTTVHRGGGISRGAFFTVLVLLFLVSAGLIYALTAGRDNNAVVMDAGVGDSALLQTDTQPTPDAPATTQVRTTPPADENVSLANEANNSTGENEASSTDNKETSAASTSEKDFEVDTSTMVKVKRPQKKADSTGSAPKKEQTKRDSINLTIPGQ
ncbi:MAG: serine/threonine-protein kinase [Flavisolibacter sp.]